MLPASSAQFEIMDGKDIVKANTVIRKLEANNEETIKSNDSDEVQLSWKTDGTAVDHVNVEYLDDDVFKDDDDGDYVPPVEKPKLSDIREYQTEAVKILTKIKDEYDNGLVRSRDENETIATTIICYPIMKNGSIGAPLILKRLKDATLEVHPGSKTKKSRTSEPGKRRDNKPTRIVKSAATKQRKVVCPICGILTWTPRNHIATHHENRRYSCPQCPNSYVQKFCLMMHMKRHFGIKDQICEMCGAAFYTWRSLARHRVIHKAERQFQCNVCSKRFVDRSHLLCHLRTHSGYKPYKCSNCTMSFIAKDRLKDHLRKHTGERPYTCQICNVGYSYKASLNKHVFRVHRVNLKYKSIHNVTEEILKSERGY